MKRLIEGEIGQCDKPDWRPLIDLLEDEQVVGDFMWMTEIDLCDGTPVQAYKHRQTRRYIHLGPTGRLRLSAG